MKDLFRMIHFWISEIEIWEKMAQIYWLFKKAIFGSFEINQTKDLYSLILKKGVLAIVWGKSKIWYYNCLFFISWLKTLKITDHGEAQNLI